MKRKVSPNPGIAVVLSFLFNGLGQIYNGQIAKGLSLMAASSLLMMTMVVGVVWAGYYVVTDFQHGWALWGALFCLIPAILGTALLGIYNLFDAYHTALRMGDDEETGH